MYSVGHWQTKITARFKSLIENFNIHNKLNKISDC